MVCGMLFEGSLAIPLCGVPERHCINSNQVAMLSCPECMSWSFTEVSEVRLEAPRAESGTYGSAMEAICWQRHCKTPPFTAWSMLRLQKWLGLPCDGHSAIQTVWPTPGLPAQLH